MSEEDKFEKIDKTMFGLPILISKKYNGTGKTCGLLGVFEKFSDAEVFHIRSNHIKSVISDLEHTPIVKTIFASIRQVHIPRPDCGTYQTVNIRTMKNGMEFMDIEPMTLATNPNAVVKRFHNKGLFNSDMGIIGGVQHLNMTGDSKKDTDYIQWCNDNGIDPSDAYSPLSYKHRNIHLEENDNVT